jgi:hypothetical protein
MLGLHNHYFFHFCSICGIKFGIAPCVAACVIKSLVLRWGWSDRYALDRPATKSCDQCCSVTGSFVRNICSIGVCFECLNS